MTQKNQLETIRVREYNYKDMLLIYGGYSMEYLTTAEYAEKWGISQRRVGIYCKEGRLEGAIIKGKTWLIPADAKKPEDPRKTRKK